MKINAKPKVILFTLGGMLLLGISASVIQLIIAAPPNPGHSWTGIGDIPVSTCSSGYYLTGLSSIITDKCVAEVGDISGITAGNGLTGDTTSGNATLHVGQGTGILVGTDVVSADTTYMQRRVSGYCNPGNSIRVINADGTVACEYDDTGITGSGSTNYVSKWTGGTSLGNSIIYDDGTNIGVGMSWPQGKIGLNNDGSAITWGYGYSKIYDNADLHIYTDDNMHFDTGNGADRMLINSSGVNIGNLCLSGTCKSSWPGTALNCSNYYSDWVACANADLGCVARAYCPSGYIATGGSCQAESASDDEPIYKIHSYPTDQGWYCKIWSGGSISKNTVQAIARCCII
jgi:hypothetical protein